MDTLGKRKNIGYFFDEEIGMYTFKRGHPMRPFRVKVTDELIKAYGMDQMMTCYDSNNYLFPDEGFE
jgi:histone deacetylase 1/2